MQYKNLIIIGTSHIAKESLIEVENTIKEQKPDIIALELDKKRYHGLLYNKKGPIKLSQIKEIGIKGFLFSLIGAFVEKKLGEYVGVAPGSEMITAIRLARKDKIGIALIDQDIDITLKRFSKTLTWKEKWNFVVDIVKGLIFRKKEVDFDLTKVPSKKVIDILIKKVKNRYPNIYKVLIEERNQVMAAKLNQLITKNPDKKILAIVGAGHEEAIINLIKKPSITYSFKIG